MAQGIVKMDYKRKSYKHGCNQGFTLIEMAFVMVILSIFLLGAMTIYFRFVEERRVERTEANVKDILDALEEFRGINGFYPCPASLSASGNDADYGTQTNCANTSVAVGSCESDNAYCVQQSIRTAAEISNRRVRIGAVPFRDVNTTEDSTYDGYGSRIFYAVSEGLTGIAGFSDSNGAIQVIDDQSGANMTPVPGSAKYIVWSAGPNKFGAFTRAGVQGLPCDGYNGRDGENCDFTTSSVARFLSGITRNAGGADRQDDLLAFRVNVDRTMGGWRLGNAGVPPERPTDMIMEDRDVMVGTVAGKPLEKLHIKGDMRIDGTSGQMKAERYCTTGGNCFDIASLVRDCPAGQYVTGIGAGGVICNRLKFGCNQGFYLRGKKLDDAGEWVADCVVMPPPAPPVPPGPGASGTSSSTGSTTSDGGASNGTDAGTGADDATGGGGDGGGDTNDGGTGSTSGETAGTGTATGGSGSNGSGSGSGSNGSGSTGTTDGTSSTTDTGPTTPPDDPDHPETPTCSEDVENVPMPCSDGQGGQYHVRYVTVCEGGAGQKVPDGDNEITACCRKSSSSTDARKTDGDCGQGSGTVNWIRTVNTSNCTWNVWQVASGSCTCKPNEIIKTNKACGAEVQIACDRSEVRYVQTASSPVRCIQQNVGIVTPGSCGPADYKWAKSATKITKIGTDPNPWLIRSGDPCSGTPTVDAPRDCQARDGDWWSFKNCTCAKQSAAACL